MKETMATNAIQLLNLLREINVDEIILIIYEKRRPCESMNPDWWIDLAKDLRLNGYYQGALETYNAAIEFFPKTIHHLLWSNRGFLFICWERYQDALDSLQMALSINSNYTKAIFNKALAYERLHDFQSAVNTYLQVIEIDPDNYYSWNNIGLCKHQLGDITSAIASYQKAIAICPVHQDSLFNLGALYATINEFSQAKKYFLQLLELYPNDQGALEHLKLIENNESVKLKAQDTYTKRILRTTNHPKLSIDQNIHEKGKEESEEIYLFLSYRYESKEHHDWVLKFADDLLKRGYKLIFDRLEIIQMIDAVNVVKTKFPSVNFSHIQYKGFERKDNDVAELITSMVKSDAFIPIITEKYRRCVEPDSSSLIHKDDGWVLDEWLLAIKLHDEGRLRWLGIWRSGPILPYPFTMETIIDFRDDQNYKDLMDCYFPVFKG